MNPFLLRQLWSAVEATQATLLLNLDDNALVQRLMVQLGAQQSLDAAESSQINHYIELKLPLIRDMAQQRLGGGFFA
jgi:hypothetical protein